MSDGRIAILGGGRIGEALLSGLLSSGWRDADEIVVGDRAEERIAELRERYGIGDDARQRRGDRRRRDSSSSP